MRRSLSFALAALVLAQGCSAGAPAEVAKKNAKDGGASASDPPNELPAPANGAAAGGLVLQGGFVVDPAARTITQRDLYLCNGVVVDDAKGKACAPAAIDVTGKYLVPGLNDMHVHTRGLSKGDGGFVDMTAVSEAPLFRAAGVTSFLDAMSDESKIFAERDAQRKGQYPGADIFSAGGAFTPTKGHGTEYGLPATSYRIVDTPGDVATQITDLELKHPDVVKIFYDHRGEDGGPDVADGQAGVLGVAMKKQVMIALIAAANERHLKTEVHIGSWNDARDAIAAGATSIAHLGEQVIPADVVAAAKAKGVLWIPTMSLYRGLTDLIANQALLDDPLLVKVTPAGILDSYRTGKRVDDPEYMAFLARHPHDGANVLALQQAGVKLLSGTDVIELGIFVGWSLHRELKLLVEAGLGPWDALRAATINAGELLGLDYGIAPGAVGNVVVLSASPIDDITNTTKIAAVVHHGALVK